MKTESAGTAGGYRVGNATELETSPRSQPKGGSEFRQLYGQATAATSAPGHSQAPTTITVRDGDTLSSIARRTMEARGLPSGPGAIARAVRLLGQANRLTNPDLIVPGQVIEVAALAPKDNFQQLLGTRPTASPSPMPPMNGPRTGEPASQVLHARAGTLPRPAVPGAAPPSTPLRNGAPPAPAHPVLEKTLVRAVALGYVSLGEVEAVRHKILELSQQHRFRPDDLAIVTLMESDGMNPRASNGRCHGVIQFCDGPNRGAASVGYREDARSITQLGVLDQLDLVGKYFEETGLKSFGRAKHASLDDLYLTILTPAARRERSPERELDIPGPQAAALHVGNDPTGPITRQSLLQGLRQIARDKLALFRPVPPREEPMRVSIAETREQTVVR